ncbi:MAG TPA: acyloxyacyl hydrolase [Acidobacteriaceae bacterium]|nr:acyloxyacyl hydrolase [Acidobacteriaceae bacterium]
MRKFAGWAAVILFAGTVSAQTVESSSTGSQAAAVQEPAAAGPAAAELAKRPWEWGPFFQGGKGIGYLIDDYKLLSAGVRLGKVITGELLPGLLRGQFEYAAELMPYWEALTPPPHEQLLFGQYYRYGGGDFHGVSITPIILRWDFQPHGRWAPWFQAAGGLIYTTHKFPPDVLVPHGQPGGTSVFNFSPQGGIGVQYFVRPNQSLMLEASGVHISSASLGDKNPGVNASVQFQIGYTWWSR